MLFNFYLAILTNISRVTTVLMTYAITGFSKYWIQRPHCQESPKMLKPNNSAVHCMFPVSDAKSADSFLSVDTNSELALSAIPLLIR